MTTQLPPALQHSIVYTPNDVTRLGTQYLDARRHNADALIPLGLPSIDKDFLPLAATELCTIIGRPGNGKTGLMMWWARSRSRWLVEHGLNDRVVVYATWEQSIEELHAFNIAADSQMSITEMARGNITEPQWDSIMAAGVKRVGLPLWFVGHSLERRKSRPNLNMTALMDGLAAIEEWPDGHKFKLDMVFIDYLQRIKFDGRIESKTIGVSDNLDRCKDGALITGCPWVVGVQSVRDVDKRDDPTPQMDDGQWTSNIEQASDAVLSVVRPIKYRQEGEEFRGVMVQGRNQMLISVVKRKLGPDNWAKFVAFDPAYNTLDELEIKNINLNDD